jgi:translation initiation factor SUI1
MNLDEFSPFSTNADPFAPNTNTAVVATGPKDKIHVRIIRQGPRTLTLIEGLDEDLDQHRIAKYMAKAFSCSSSVQKDKEGNEIIQLQGNQLLAVRDWLQMQEILTAKEVKERLVLHGV